VTVDRALIKIIALTTLALALGYVIGRQHVKYQIQSRLSELESVFSGGPPRSSSRFEGGPAGQTNTAAPQAERVPQLQIGQTFKGDGFAITLNSAAVFEPEVRGMLGDRVYFKSPDLILSFTFTNTDDRKILSFYPANMFTAGDFRLRDDVDNVIRGMDYGFGNELVDALTGSVDIFPGDAVTHIESFSVPPPKTKYLTLTIDTACLDGDGRVRFTIPASAIAQ